ncbi:MAG: MarR family transcriptional regulator [Halofilum sp. (in: g-proteobacteria)]|nr:MarR family transcriptional regulator [Halofilum sp. (in: g-proteobacteria)]
MSTRTRMEKPRVSRALRRMADKGLIEREPDARDQRFAVIRASRAGARLYARIAPLALEWEQALLCGLSSAERRTLHELIDRLETRVQELRAHGGS